MNRLGGWLRRLRPTTFAAALTPQTWRASLLSGTLFLAAVFGLPAAVVEILTPPVSPLGAATVGLAYLVVLGLAVFRRLPYRLRAAGLAIVALLLSLAALIEAGPTGPGRLLLIGFSAAAAAFFGVPGAIASLLLGVAALPAVGYAISAGLIPAPGGATATASASQWAALAGGHALVAGLVSGLVLLLEAAVAQALRRNEDLLAQAEAERANLERLVAERARGAERRALQLQTTAEIARVAVQSTDPSPLMIQAVELIRERFGFYHASIFTLDETGGWAVLRASTGEAGRALLTRGHRLAVGSASMIGWASANRLPRVSNDVAADPFHMKNPLLPDTRAECALPMIVGGSLIGMLDVQSTEPGAFSEEDVRALEAIAGELAIAIENARLMRQAEDELERTEGMFRGRARQSWARFAQSGIPTMFRLGAGDGTFRDSSLTLAQKAVEDATTARSDDGTEIAVPVVVRGEAVATISARRPAEAEPWSEDDIALIEAAASQVGLALESARQYAEEQRRVAELEVVNRVAQAVSQLLRLDSLYRVVHAQMTQVLPETDLAIGLYEGATDQLAYPFWAEGGDVSERPLTPVGTDLAGYVLRTRQPLSLAGDLVEQAAALGVDLPPDPPASWMGAPLLAGESLLGILSMQDRRQAARFSEDDAALLATVASQVATAIQNSRLLDETQRAARRERLIHEITSKLRRAPDIRSILDTTAREVGRALNASRASVRLGETRPEEATTAGAQESEESRG